MGALIAKIIYKNDWEQIQIKDELKDTCLWDYTVKDIDGKEVPLRVFATGKKAVLFVNVASAWGFTKQQYTALIQLHQKYREQGLEIIAFPCNQFGQQEPAMDADIKMFVR